MIKRLILNNCVNLDSTSLSIFLISKKFCLILDMFFSQALRS